MYRTRRRYPWLIAFVLFGTAPLVWADLVFTSPPREQNSNEGGDIYVPIAEYFSKLLGRKVVYHNPGNWLTYQKEMRSGLYDIVFDGPHFNSWRTVHVDHEVLVRLPGSIEFLVVANTNSAISRLEDLVGANICSISPPNLGTMLLLDKFRNPVRQPVVKSIKGETAEVYKAFKDGQCKAAVLRTIFYNNNTKVTDGERKQLKVLFNSAALPNQGISVSNRITTAEKKLIQKDITAGEGSNVFEKLVNRYGQKNDKAFVITNNQEYQGINMLLEGVIYGW